MTRTLPPAIKVRDLADLIHLIPSLLGFHPEESVVAVLIEGGHVVVTARTDLQHVATRDAAASVLGTLWSRYSGAACVVVAFSADVNSAWRCLDAVGAALPPWTPWQSAVVCGSSWFAEPGSDAAAYDPLSRAACAEAAFHGIRVLPTRGELAASLTLDLSHAELDAALAEVLERPVPVVAGEAIALAASFMRQPWALTPAQRALLAVGAHNPAVLEALILGCEAEDADRARSLWGSVVRGVDERTGAAASLALGLAAWVGGDGALQCVCLERAQPHLSDSPWYRLLDLINQLALPPSEWPTIRRELMATARAA